MCVTEKSDLYMVYVFNPIEMSSYFTNSHGHSCKCLWYTEILSMLTMTTASLRPDFLARDAMCIDAVLLGLVFSFVVDH
jgi:hypothetical protein